MWFEISIFDLLSPERMYHPVALADRKERHLYPPYCQTFPQHKVYVVHRKLRQHYEFYGWLAEEYNIDMYQYKIVCILRYRNMEGAI